MAYRTRRKTQSRRSNYSSPRRSSYGRRTTTRRRSSARRSGSARAQTIRIVVQQAAPVPTTPSGPLGLFQKEAPAPKKAKF